MRDSMAKYMSLVDVEALMAGKQPQQQEHTVEPTQHAICAAQHVPNTNPMVQSTINERMNEKFINLLPEGVQITK